VGINHSTGKSGSEGNWGVKKPFGVQLFGGSGCLYRYLFVRRKKRNTIITVIKKVRKRRGLSSVGKKILGTFQCSGRI